MTTVILHNAYFYILRIHGQVHYNHRLCEDRVITFCHDFYATRKLSNNLQN